MQESGNDLEELDYIIANDEGSNTREEWRALALRLRHELDRELDKQIRPFWYALGIGIILGVLLDRAIIHFHLY